MPPIHETPHEQVAEAAEDDPPLPPLLRCVTFLLMIRPLFLALLGFLASVAPLGAQSGADTLEAGSVRVIHAPRELPLAREVLAAATRPMPLPGFGRGAVPESTTIFLTPTPRDFSAVTGGGAPEWAGGI